MAVRLSPQRKRRIRHRANVEARRTYQPAINAARGEAAAARRSYRRAASAARGYTSYGVKGINQQIRQTKRSGISGMARRQTLNYMRGMRAQTKAALPFLLSDAQTQLSSDLATAREHLTSARVDKLSHAGSNYTDYLNAAYKAKAERVQSQREGGKAGGKAADKLGINTKGMTDTQVRAAIHKAQAAKQELTKFLDAWKANEQVDVGGGETANMRDLYPLKTGADWRKVATVLAKAETIDSVDAMQQIREFVKRKRKKRQAAARVWGVSGRAYVKPSS